MTAEMPFEFLPHTADAGIVARGKTPAELFENAARGIFSYIALSGKAGTPFKTTVDVSAVDRETLLVAWLNELLYLSGREKARLDGFRVTDLADTSISAEISGSRLEGKHGAEREIKAVTYHELSIEKTPAGFTAKIIFDV
jgi:Uncharacterized conserved protein